MKILQRLRPRRPVMAVVAAMLGVLSLSGALVGFAGSASAALTATPITYPPGLGPDTIGLAPSGVNPAGNPDAIVAGQANQPGAAFVFGLSDQGTVTSGVTSGTWAVGDAIHIPVFDSAGHINNVTGGDFVEFSSAPIVACQGGGAGATAPTFNVSLSTNPNDTPADTLAGLTDVLNITFTDSPGIGSPAIFTCGILGVAYTTGVATPTGNITFDSATGGGATYEQGTAPAGTNPIPAPPTSNIYEQSLGVVPDATVVGVTESANNPPVSVLPNAINAPISNIVITETIPGSVPAGYICLIPDHGGFTTSATEPTLTVTPSNTGGTSTVTGVVNGVGAPGSHGYAAIEGDVLSPSSTVPTTLTFSGLTVDAPTDGPVSVTILIGANAGCTTGTQLTVTGNPDFNNLEIYAVGNPTSNTRIAGSDADQTAVAALEFQYPPTPGFCIDQGTNPNPNRFDVGSTIIVATDGSWQDALTASYLASYFGTGVLLTPTGQLSSYTAEAIQNEGASNIIIVGGTLAVSQAVQNQLAGTNAYLCGGGTPQMTALGTPLKLNVQRVWGPTADDTAEAVDTFVNSGYVGQVNFADAFGKYNDTLGTDSGSSQTIPVRTAILVTDGFFQDASSASAMSYYDDFPIVLTNTNSLSPQAENTLLDLGIQQVIELGGPLAISDSVNASLISQGISVLRIAGADGSETSVQLAKFELNQLTDGSHNPAGLGWSFSCTRETFSGLGIHYYSGCHERVALARGDFFADALTSSVVTGGGAYGATYQNPSPIILAENPTTLGTYATAFFNAAGSPYGIDPFSSGLNPIPGSGSSITSIIVFGGPLAIANSTLQAALNAIAAG